MSIEMEVWEEDKQAFESLVAEMQRLYEAYYNKPSNRATVYWDAVRYDLYSVVPIYAEGSL